MHTIIIFKTHRTKYISRNINEIEIMIFRICYVEEMINEKDHTFMYKDRPVKHKQVVGFKCRIHSDNTL